ncbi:VOC family protein [Amycolatopsis jiangsuensis]|uniref:Catechol 2,3-dioxygenase-like lactoylglutathione lyase family enzyme n=1 Tax=Amycolatopsis jiangsuensis TaxID=1181879 RepID=A0A840J779_9PSEU|nr:VOC family protein [Amycolatopsis jiangsuensis]MBB4689569.1 catechol 2,3-dioxygenase-like lactoylglutathione lyase family enzyme [Amycolatopsis jiangsuensis]
MSVSLNHTIVLSKDKVKAANFLSELLGLETNAWGPFIRVRTGQTDIEFMNIEDSAWNDHITPQHLCFLIDEQAMDVLLEGLRRHDVQPYEDMFYEDPGVNSFYGGRGCYIRDIVDGHLFEFITAPYEGKPANIEKGRWNNPVDPTAVGS